MWAREDQVSAEELDELRVEIADTMDDHAKVQRKKLSWRQRLLPSRPLSRADSVVHQKMRRLRSHHHGEQVDQTPVAAASGNTDAASTSSTRTSPPADCEACNTAHRHEFAPDRFDTVEHSLSAIHDLACYLNKAPRTIWLALEGIFTTRQTTSAPTLFRHRVAILARVLPTAVALLLLAFVVLHFLMPDHQTDAGYTPLFSELAFLLFLALFTTVVFFLLGAAMLLMKSSLQERFLNGFSRLINWSIPITLSFFMASPEFLLLFQELASGSSTNATGIENVLSEHNDVIETIYWTVLVYVGIYTGIFFSFIAFSKVFQEQREYVHRHEVLRDVIPILVADRSDRPQQ